MGRRANGMGTLYRRNGWYYAQMKLNGKMTRMSLNTRDRKEALRGLNELSFGHDLSSEERLAALAVKLKPKSATKMFDEAWNGYAHAPENVAQSEKARSEDLGIWKNFIRWLHGQQKPGSRLNCKGAHPEADCLDDITPAVASEYVEWLRDNRAPHTANRAVRILRRMWRLNGAETNPWAAFRKFKESPAKRRAFTREEVDRLIATAKGELRTLLTVGAYTGMRLGDCQRLRYESIDAKAGVIRTGKTGKVVRIPIHPVLRAALGKAKKSGYVMPKIAEWPKWKVSDAVQAHFMKCGIYETEKRDGYKKRSILVGFHSFRSTFITRLGEAGVPLPVVREMVGHVSEEMTMRYFRSDDAMAAKAIAALG